MRLLDEAGVDPQNVFARVDENGTPVLECPGGVIEMPAGTFDKAAGGGLRGGGTDASVSAPVREPELVNAGGVRGETAPAPVNAIVDEAPVRTETGGSGGSGGDTDAPSGDAAGAGDGSGPGDGSAPVDRGGEGDGWTQGPEHRGGDIDPEYGEPRADHGTLADQYAPPAEVPADIRHLVSDPEAPYGRGSDGEPYTRAEWEERYMGPDNRPIYPGNDGAVPGSRVSYTDMEAFRRDYGDTIDRFGGSGGAYLSPEGVLFEQRALPGGNLNAGYHVFRLTDELPPGVHIEVSEVAPAFGQPGGGIQLQFVDDVDGVLSVEQLLSNDYRIIESTTPTTPSGLDAGANALSDFSSPVPGAENVTALHFDSIPADLQRSIIRHEYPGLLGVNATRFDGWRAGTLDPQIAKLGWNNNCTNCVIAVDRAFSDTLSSAMPSVSELPITRIPDALGIDQRFVTLPNYESVVTRMEALPEGSRGVVYIRREDYTGHVFNVVHDKSGVVFLDGQTGMFARLEDVRHLRLLVTHHA